MSSAIQATGTETFASDIAIGVTDTLISAGDAATKPFIVEHVWMKANGPTGTLNLDAAANTIAGTGAGTQDVVANGIFVDRLALTVTALVTAGDYSVTVRYL
jgi:hypothetical protein